MIPAFFFGLLLVGACLIRLYRGGSAWWWAVLFAVLVVYIFGGMLVWDFVTNPD